MENYVRVAQSLVAEQARLADAHPSEFAGLAWIGYHPPMPDVRAFEVFSDDRAATGAVALSDDLKALRSARSERGIELSVVAHSYGTDVAALALQRADADHLVLLGSAGIADDVVDSSDLHVPEGQVFASQARRDEWAPIGQGFSQRTDPTSTAFGAQVFSSESAVVDGKQLWAVSKHGPIGAEVGWDASYFTRNTSALRNTALATIGDEQLLIMGGTAEDRVVRNGKSWQ